MKGALYIAAVLTIGAAAVQAQDRPSPAALRTRRSFGLCIARDVDGSKRLLATMPGTATEVQAAAQLTRRDCLEKTGVQQLGFRTSTIRGLAAEAVLKLASREGDSAAWANAEMFNFPSQDQVAALSEETRSNIYLIQIGSCVASLDETGVRLLLDQPAGGHDEQQAFKSISGTLSKCTPPGGTFSINPAKLRGALAEGLYRVEAGKHSGKSHA